MHQYYTKITTKHLDSFRHVNNAEYLNLFEEARWDLITKNGYGLDKIQSSGLGPVILEVKVSFLQELLLDDEIIIQTRLLSYDKKIGKLEQTIEKGDELCSHAEFVFGLFNLEKRKLVLPTPEWLKAVGYKDDE